MRMTRGIGIYCDPGLAGARINVGEPDFGADGGDSVTEGQGGFSVPGGSVRDAAGGEQIAGA
jgi:hypothetical protein